MKYLVVIYKDQDSCSGVSVPDVPGCFSAGETIDEALHNAKEAISDHLKVLADEGRLLQPIPNSASIRIIPITRGRHGHM